MTLNDVCYLLKKYSECPKCQSVYIGNGRGTIDVDTDKGVFVRTCACGWGVNITEKKS